MDPQRRPLSAREAIRQRAQSYLGTPYLWGGADKQGIDCSAFISRAWGIGRQTTDTLAGVADPIDRSRLQPGDALNLTTGRDPRGYGHVRMFDGWADPDHKTMWVYESSTATGGAARRVIPYDAAYTPMRLRGLTDEAPQTTADRMHAQAPPEQAEQQPPGRPTATPIAGRPPHVMASVAVGGGAEMESDRPPSSFEPPSRFAPPPPAAPATSAVKQRIEAQLKAAQGRVPDARTKLAAVQAEAEPSGEDATEKDRSAWRTRHDKAVADARDDVDKAEAQVRTLETQAAAEDDRIAAAAAKPPPATAKPTTTTPSRTARQVLRTNPDGTQEWVDNENYADPVTTPRATRTYKAGGATYSETAPDAGGFSPLPDDVQDPDRMTPYQSAELPIQQQHANASTVSAAASQLQAQVAAGRLSFDQAKTIFDYVVAQKAPVEEGGKLYKPGRSPSNETRKFYGLSEQPYAPVDAAGFFGRPELNQYVRGPDPFGAGPMSPAEYQQRQAGTFQGGPGPPPMAGAAPAPAAPMVPPPQAPPEQAASSSAGTMMAAEQGGFAPPPPPQQPQPPPQQSVPGFGAPAGGGYQAMQGQQDALMADIEKTRRMLIAEGFSPQAADRAARHVVGAGAGAGQTPY